MKTYSSIIAGVALTAGKATAIGNNNNTMDNETNVDRRLGNFFASPVKTVTLPVTTVDLVAMIPSDDPMYPTPAEMLVIGKDHAAQKSPGSVNVHEVTYADMENLRDDHEVNDVDIENHGRN